ncbi:MAG: chitobiase/beta-hexosaminidase C-terminal domain-containing protein, partial [Bacteroidales bacterium]|nr:chitobiase/beta-hexosaminidase C-terminal domain-containing protein [Bacteroidales bacterium]
MRKLFSLLTGAAVIMMSAACTTESESPVIEKGKELATIIASVESSRTTVETEEGLAYYNWQKNEAISVIEEDGTDPSIFTVSDAATGAFTGIKSENKGLSYAVSPAVALESGMDVGGELFEYTIEMPETWENYEPGTTNAIMIGYSTGTDGNGKYLFNFDHAAALVKVTYENVPVGTKYFCFETDQIINGLWEGIDKIQGVELETPASGNKATFLELAEAVAFPNQTMDFYVPVPVGTYHSFSISLLDANLGTIDETARAKDQFEVELHRGELYSTPVITLPETPLYGSYIIVSKAATKGNWVVMQAAVNDKGRWLYDDSGIAYTEDVNLYDSSIDFPAYSNISYRFDVIELEEGGYVLRNAQSGNYVQFVGTASNAGKEVSEDEKAAFDVFKINGDGTWTIGSWYNDTDFYSLQYNVGNYFTFYKSNQAGIYLIPYVGAAAPVQLSGSCSKNTVTLTAIPEEAEIRYTVDESEPTANSILYEGPFGITESCTVKAVAFAPNSDYQDSDVLVLECTYVEPGTAAYYEKVTEAPNDWTGDYLIVYEAD